MKTITHTILIDSYSDAAELSAADRSLLEEARKATAKAYAPYSHFHVGAVLTLSNGETVTGTNQENASFPAGICAERVALSTASVQFPGIRIEALAVSYDNKQGPSVHPISPCGICRQTLLEYEQKQNHPIRLILGGQSGPVYVVPSANDLLPMSFSADDMSKEHHPD